MKVGKRRLITFARKRNLLVRHTAKIFSRRGSASSEATPAAPTPDSNGAKTFDFESL